MVDAARSGDLETAFTFACAAVVLEPASAGDLKNLSQVHLQWRDYFGAAEWLERLTAAGAADPDAIRFLLFAHAQTGAYERMRHWRLTLPSLVAATAGLDASSLARLEAVFAGYESWSRGLSKPPALRFFDEADEHDETRFLRKAILACAEGAHRRALQFLSTLEFKAGLGLLRHVEASDVAALKARICAALGIESERLGTGPLRGFMVIRSHASGFCADLLHTAIQLIVAHLARRHPVVHWGRESAYWRPGSANLWVDFFEPSGEPTLQDLARGAYSFFPPFFTAANLEESHNSPWFNNQAGAAHDMVLGRHEDVVVVERFSALAEVLALLPPGHEFRQTHPLELLKSFFRRFIRVRRELSEQVAGWLRQRALGRPVIAAHYRLQSSHKVEESNEKQFVSIDRHFRCVDEFLRRAPEACIFLLTDFEPAVLAFSERYPQRVICYGAERLRPETVADVQLGLTRTVGNFHLAEEVLRDVATAAHCRHFVLDGASNVSIAIHCLSAAMPSDVAWVREPHVAGTPWADELSLPTLAGESAPFVVDMVSNR